MGKSSRTKGAAGERELIGLLRDELGFIISRNLSQTRDGGHDLVGIPGFSVEVKRVEKSCWPTWCRQAERQAGGLIPVVARRANGKPWVFRVKFDGEWLETDLLGFCEIVREGF